MTALRLTLRFVICVLGTPLMLLFCVLAVVFWALANDTDGFALIIRPWVRNLRHPFTP